MDGIQLLQGYRATSGRQFPEIAGTQVFCYEFCEIFKNSFFYRTPSVAAF